MKILVVDDSETARDVAEATLLSGGYEDIAFAASGAEALSLLDAESGEGPAFDVILLDVVMPEMDGIQACARIRADARYADAPIIMVTSLSDMDSLSQAFVAGATDYVTKPFQRIELLARVRSALRLKGELDRRRLREAELRRGGQEEAGQPDSGVVEAQTGLFSRDAADALLRHFGAAPTGRTLCVLCLQIDHFDRLTEQSAETAEAALLSVAEALRGVPAPLDSMLASYSPGVFVIICPDLSEQSGTALAESARASVQVLAAPHRDSAAASVLTVSAGAAAGPVNAAETPRRLLSAAIVAVERAADAGGNRVSTSQQEPLQ